MSSKNQCDTMTLVSRSETSLHEDIVYLCEFNYTLETYGIYSHPGNFSIQSGTML
jgi:hypothetical protein